MSSISLISFYPPTENTDSCFHKHISKCEAHAVDDTHKDGQKGTCKGNYLKYTKGTYFLKGPRVWLLLEIKALFMGQYWQEHEDQRDRFKFEF